MADVTGPFDFVNSILQGNTAIDFTEENASKYSQFLTNRALSMHADTLPFAAEANRFRDVTNQMHYDLMFYGIRKYKRPRGKWPKAEERPELDLLMKYYNCGSKKAADHSRTHTEEQINNIRLALSEGGEKKPK